MPSFSVSSFVPEPLQPTAVIWLLNSGGYTSRGNCDTDGCTSDIGDSNGSEKRCRLHVADCWVRWGYVCSAFASAGEIRGDWYGERTR